MPTNNETRINMPPPQITYEILHKFCDHIVNGRVMDIRRMILGGSHRPGHGTAIVMAAFQSNTTTGPVLGTLPGAGWMRLLLSPVYLKDIKGWTPLRVAAAANAVESLNELLSHVSIGAVREEILKAQEVAYEFASPGAIKVLSKKLSDALLRRDAKIAAQATTISERDASIVEKDREIAAQTTTIEERDASIVEKDEQIAAQATTIAEKDRQLERSVAQTERVTRELSTLQEEASGLTALLRESQQKMEQMTFANLRAKQKGADALAEKDRLIVERDQTIAAQATVIEEREASITEKDERIAQLSREKSAAESESRGRERTINELNLSKGKLEREKHTAQQQLAEEKRKTSGLERQVTAHDAELSTLRARSAESDTAALQIRVAELEGKVESYEAQLREKDEKIAALESSSERLLQEMRTVRRAARQTQREADALLEVMSSTEDVMAEEQAAPAEPVVEAAEEPILEDEVAPAEPVVVEPVAEAYPVPHQGNGPLRIYKECVVLAAQCSMRIEAAEEEIAKIQADTKFVRSKDARVGVVAAKKEKLEAELDQYYKQAQALREADQTSGGTLQAQMEQLEEHEYSQKEINSLCRAIRSERARQMTATLGRLLTQFSDSVDAGDARDVSLAEEGGCAAEEEWDDDDSASVAVVANGGAGIFSGTQATTNGHSSSMRQQ